MISRNIIAREIICNPFGDGEFCNAYTYHAEDAYKYLQKIYKKDLL